MAEKPRRIHEALLVLAGLGAATAAIWMHAAGFSCGDQADHYSYTQLARRWFSGGVLYDDVNFDKPPGTVVSYAVPDILFPHTLMTLPLTLVAVLCLQAAILIWFLRPSVVPALAVICLVILLPTSYWDWRWLSTEHLANVWLMPLLAICLRIHDRRAMSAVESLVLGGLVGLAYLTRPTAATYMLVPIVTAILLPHDRQHRLRLVAGIAGGCAMSLAASVLFILLEGNLPKYIYTMLVYPSIYAGNAPTDARWKLLGHAYDSSLLTILVIGLLVAASCRCRWPLMAAFLSGGLAAAAPNREFPHYLMSLLPPVAAAFAAPMDWPALGDRTAAGRRAAAVWLGHFAAIGLTAYLLVTEIRTFPTHLERATRDVTQMIATTADAQTNDAAATLWVVAPNGFERIGYLSKLRPCLPFIWEMGQPSKHSPQGSAADSLARLLAKPPTVLVVFTDELRSALVSKAKDDTWPAVLAGFLREHAYQHTATHPVFQIFVLEKFAVARRKGNALHDPPTKGTYSDHN